MPVEHAPLLTPRLMLQLIDDEECAAIAAVAEGRRAWGSGYPTEGDVLLARCRSGEAALLSALEGSPWVPWQVLESASGLAVGGAGFRGSPSDGVVEIGYGIAEPYRGRGYATEAVMALLDLAGANGVHLVEATTDPGNVASQAVLVRAGFVRAGVGGAGMRGDELLWQVGIN